MRLKTFSTVFDYFTLDNKIVVEWMQFIDLCDKERGKSVYKSQVLLPDKYSSYMTLQW